MFLFVDVAASWCPVSVRLTKQGKCRGPSMSCNVDIFASVSPRAESEMFLFVDVAASW